MNDETPRTDAAHETPRTDAAHETPRTDAAHETPRTDAPLTEADLVLLERGYDGTLEAADLPALEALLRSRPAARARWRALAAVAALLEEAALGEPDAAEDVEVFPAEVAAPRAGRKTELILTALATLAAVLLLQFAWPTRTPAGNAAVPESPAPPTFAVLAAVDRTDAAFLSRVGERLGGGVLKLERGAVELRFDRGPRITLLAPAEFEIEGPAAATLRSGKLRFRNDVPGDAFDLRTPRSLLIDLGTEYAVSTGADGEEVHVFDGEVWRSDRRDEEAVTFLHGGEARRFGPDDDDGTAIAPSAAAFSAEPFPPSLPGRRLAAEAFEYPAGIGLNKDQARGGFGWESGWVCPLPGMPGKEKLPARFEPTGLSFPGTDAAGGALLFRGRASALRRLAEPLRLDRDGTYYFRLLFEFRPGAEKGEENALFVTWRHRDKSTVPQRLVTVVQPGKALIARLDGTRRRAWPGGLRGRTMLVGKVVARASGPDRVYWQVFDKPLPATEPSDWFLACEPTESDAIFDTLSLHSTSARGVLVDELRFGTGWDAIVR